MISRPPLWYLIDSTTPSTFQWPPHAPVIQFSADLQPLYFGHRWSFCNIHIRYLDYSNVCRLGIVWQDQMKTVYDLYQYGMSPVGYSFHAGVGWRQFTSSYVPVGIVCLNSFGSLQVLKCFCSTLTRTNFISVQLLWLGVWCPVTAVITVLRVTRSVPEIHTLSISATAATWCISVCDCLRLAKTVKDCLRLPKTWCMVSCSVSCSSRRYKSQSELQ